MGINVRQKGKDGELEFCNRFTIFFPEPLKRNLLQTREGGADVSGCHPFQIEVKRCQKIEQPKWWRQVTAACNPSEIPIVAFRQNNSPWKFLLPSWLLRIDHEGFVEATEEIFLKIVLAVYEGNVPPRGWEFKDFNELGEGLRSAVATDTKPSPGLRSGSCGPIEAGT